MHRWQPRAGGAREAAVTGSGGRSALPRLVLKQKPAEAGVFPPTWSCGWQGPTNRAQPPALRTLQTLVSLGPHDPAVSGGALRGRPSPRPRQHCPAGDKAPGPPDAPRSCPSEARIPFTVLPSGVPSSFLPSCTPKEQSPQDRLQEGGNPPAPEHRKGRWARRSDVPSGPSTQGDGQAAWRRGGGVSLEATGHLGGPECPGEFSARDDREAQCESQQRKPASRAE